ncbi:uncharacterized protein (TIGR02680 family) [Lipingzhangella halophila]|uniref:Uncharacterized protein (TIGR02680 family) n=1 Tax=Lipingzhangella halophila TaxID=1783352 RepID=A0A7W7W6D5_9ACTN|nr:TIGR02680 family protein [Lipingzhangella halophila]MBB4934755.1 uncharacterized protein (TIGR02680 family) [Lipingzhangella halophila]
MTEPRTDTTGASLPVPGQARWQPTRVGVIDMFYYDVEEFHFRDGRLLLRGNNGTGKSKVLALTLPFLLDGDLSAHRVEPDGDPKKRMEWNLLLGDEHPHPERLGYTWMEFGRAAEDGTSEFRTLGCGMKAVRGRGIARHWFFVTDQRVGLPGTDGVRLLDATGTALSRDRLEEALRGRGMVYDTARTYRRAVDEHLFGLGEQRYSALVDLLIQLRQPQLSKRPNESALSRALTEALPPMDQAVIADVAEAFRSLDEDRAQLDSMVDAERAASAFLEHYRRYAQVAARRRARLPRERNREYESLRSALGETEARRHQAQETIETAESELARQEERHTRLTAEERALRAGPEMRNARELELAAEEARRTAQQARSATGDRDRAAGDRDRAERRLAETEQRLTAASDALRTGLETTAERAETAGIGREHARETAALAALAGIAGEEAGPSRGQAGGASAGTDEDSGQNAESDALRAAVEALAARRERAVEHVESLARESADAEQSRGRAEERLADAESGLTARAERAGQAQDAVADTARAHLDAVRTHLAGCAELRPADQEGLLDRLQDWATHLSGPNPARAEAEAAARASAAAFAEESAALGVRREDRARADEELRAELEGLRAGGQHAPRQPHTRSPDARTDRPGAPLWKLVDFADDGAERSGSNAGLEAALEVSGLLDAWIAPDGTVLDASTHDVLLTAGAAVPGATLANALRPAVDAGDPRAAAVGTDTVARVLAAIGLGADHPATTWVSADGRFRVGALTGRWAKEHAEYVGEGAREAARRARIAAVEAERGDLAAEISALEERVAAIEARRTALDSELAALPTDEDLRAAHATLVEASRQLTEAREHHEELARKAGVAANAARQAADTLHQAAEELRVPAGTEALRGLRTALTDYRLALADLWPALRQLHDAGQAARADRDDTARLRAHHEELAERAAYEAATAATAEQRHSTLRETVGAAVAELERRLAENQRAREDCEERQRQARRDQEGAVEQRGHADGRIEQLRTDIDAAAASRAEAIAALRRFTGTGLLAVALPDLVTPPVDREWAARPAVEVARAVEAGLTEADDSDRAWDRVQKRLSEELNTLRDVLSQHGHSASAQSLEEGVVVRVVFQGRERGVPELAAALAEEIAERRRILSAREREILENHLITEVAGTLQELVGSAERQVAQLNAELDDRPTSTGMRLRLVWRPSRKDAPTGLEAARERLLRQHSDAWSPQDREAIGEFLQAHIDRVRARDQRGGTWLEHLTEALDYRSWHEFAVERHQNGKWNSATGPASGGERVLSVSVPLFAAASSHYASAGNPHAPRLITLDEAFAGVDDDSRAKCLGLLRSFDLDVVMTSEREWGCYPEVPGLAIAHLSRVDGVPAVLVTRWEWDGSRRTRVADPPSFAASGADGVVVDHADADTEQEPLWS